MSNSDLSNLPARVVVAETVSGRYDSGSRPENWDDRVSGTDVIRTSDGVTVTLQSDGMQSTPDSGWVLMLTDGDNEKGFHWTLYGLSQNH